MKRALAVLVILVALAAPVMAEVTVMPGISFMGSYLPAITIETIVADQASAKVFLGVDSVIASLRHWPWGFGFGENSIPVFAGFGLVTRGMDGQYVAGLFAEAGVRLVNMFDAGFSMEQTGATGRIALNFGLSFALKF